MTKKRKSVSLVLPNSRAANTTDENVIAGRVQHNDDECVINMGEIQKSQSKCVLGMCTIEKMLPQWFENAKLKSESDGEAKEFLLQLLKELEDIVKDSLSA